MPASAMETADTGACKGSRQRKRVKGRCPLRGCRGGVSPCAGSGGSPGAAEQTRKKEQKKPKFPSGCLHPQWKRQTPEPARKRASGNGSRGEAPCAGAGAALAPAQVRAAARAQHKERIQRKKKKREFPSRRRSPPALGTAGSRNPKGSRQRLPLAPPGTYCPRIPRPSTPTRCGRTFFSSNA